MLSMAKYLETLASESGGTQPLNSTNFFGHYSMNSGIMSIYSTIYMSLGIAALYLWLFIDPTDQAFKLIWLVRFHTITLFATVLCYSLDGMLFVIDKRMFCQMQA